MKTCPACGCTHIGQPHVEYHASAGWLGRLLIRLGRNCLPGPHLHYTCLYCGFRSGGVAVAP